MNDTYPNQLSKQPTHVESLLSVAAMIDKLDDSVRILVERLDGPKPECDKGVGGRSTQEPTLRHVLETFPDGAKEKISLIESRIAEIKRMLRL